MRQWKVGTISMGLLLILLGVLLLGNTIWEISISEIIVYAWPLILILLGIEVLLYSFFKKDGPIRFDVFSIIILFLALFFTFTLYSIQETGIFNAIRGEINNNAYTIDINETLTIPENVNEVVIEAPNGDFKIIGKEGNTADINGTVKIGSATKEEAEKILADIMTVKVIGNQAVIRIDEKRSLFNGDPFNNIAADLKISVPKDLKITAELINGDISANNLEGSGAVKGVNGAVKVENAKGNYEIEAVNGEIEIIDVRGDIKAKTVNGEIDLVNTIGSLDAETVNGEINASSAELTGDWDIRAVNGEITIQIPSSSDASIKAKSSLGSVDGNLAWIEKDTNKEIKLGDNKEATLGNGKYKIDLNNEHGDIEVELK